jgi:beta-xylosidase
MKVKVIIIGLLVACLNVACNEIKSQKLPDDKGVFKYMNPISKGIDTKGLRDCQVFRDGNYWYMTGTSYPHWGRQETNGQLNKGVVLYKSKDLINWEYVNYVVKAGDKSKWYHLRFWAPEIQKIQGKYYALFNCNNEQLGYPGQNPGYAVADQVEGPYKIVTENKPLCQGNDLTFFEDKDGKVWAFWNRGREFGIGFAQIDLATATFLTEPQSAIRPADVDFAYDENGNVLKVPGYDGKPIPKVQKYHAWDAIGIEGAYVIEDNGTYYLFYSSWTRGYEIGYATAKSIQGPWTKNESNPFYGAQSKKTCEKNGFEYTGDPKNPFNQVGHNAIFRGPDGRYWLSCHGIKASKTDEQPFLVIDPIWFDEQGRVKSNGPTYTEQRVKLNN